YKFPNNSSPSSSVVGAMGSIDSQSSFSASTEIVCVTSEDRSSAKTCKGMNPGSTIFMNITTVIRYDNNLLLIFHTNIFSSIIYISSVYSSTYRKRVH